MSINTSNRFKFLTAFVSIFLLSIIYFSVNSHAEEFNYTEDGVNYTVIEVDLDNNQRKKCRFKASNLQVFIQITHSE
ncbi:hypothetical protein FOH38_17740 [Lysinibacillus fusiformis]|nr:hypothetical protein FOH38_17740 [Lysinibacillus fusiformis]